MAKFEIIPNLVFYSRKEWVANVNLPRLGGKVDRNDRTHVFIHHTVTPDSDATPNIWETEDEILARMRKLQVIRPDLGLDVPYNFVAFIMKDGKLAICEGRGEDRTGAHTKGHNTKAIAVSFAGNFEDLSVSGANLKEKMSLLSHFLGWLRFDPSHEDYGQFREMRNLGSLAPTGRKVFAHSDIKATACPGHKLERHLDELDFLNPADF
jgi:hypothetical protein